MRICRRATVGATKTYEFDGINTWPYDIALTIILLIAAMVIVVDQITGKLRKELLK